MTTLFVSDLHIDAAHPAIAAQFLAFLAGEARQARTLYVLGDLFEVWVGDDDTDPHKGQVSDALRRLVDAGVPCFFMHGNRDFLIGRDFARRSGATLLDDPTVVTVEGQRVLLAHGDALCTDDVDYQAFRTMVRDPQWQSGFLSMPLDARRRLAAEARAASKTSMAGKSAQIMDVNGQAVAAILRSHRTDVLIHGHTHRPAIHELEVAGRPCRRIVLGDWYEQGSVLRWSADGYRLDSMPRD